MANRDLTAANSVVMLSIDTLYPTPMQLFDFSAEDIFDADDVDTAEIQQGIDGKMSSGFIYVPVPWNITLMANADANDIFDVWYGNEQVAKRKYSAQVSVYLPALQRKWDLANGVLTRYKPMPAGKKILQPRKFTITFERLTPAVS